MDILDLIGETAEIRHLHERIDRTQGSTYRTEEATVQLEARMRALEIANTALWSLLKSKFGCTDEELRETMRESGPANPREDHCPSCGRNVLVKDNPTCSWCGLPLDRHPFGAADVE